ncbi:maleylpyruvate isomerase family mycothiol-dependent enzyme [Gordonia sp. PKS22-38]|uniref:Maleylpyruvate isomerase family mycothiol-dependent enzyme n=1 Tax=Gordonia prachuapensis TaxID=3115651 RepID=A0ABU7MWW0_9ACTN|nr:maleylpyruvate isomerase family mycothiol-dependent enzyme [Gordonia sp. PKS22-38]
MTPEEWLHAIRAESAVLADTGAEVLGAEIPACPGWTVHDLLGHVGAVHRWAADRIDGTRLYRGYDGIEVPAGEAVIDWYGEGRDQLIASLTAKDPDDTVPAIGGPKTVAFWYRRQANELAVHRWDLESATVPGGQRAIDPTLAVDGIDEWLEVFAPRFIARGNGVPAALVGRTVHLHATDIDDGEWLWEITPEGISHRRGHAKADVALRGPISDLLLMLWHRRSHKDLDVVGDDALPVPILDLVHVT